MGVRVTGAVFGLLITGGDIQRDMERDLYLRIWVAPL